MEEKKIEKVKYISSSVTTDTEFAMLSKLVLQHNNQNLAEEEKEGGDEEQHEVERIMCDKYRKKGRI